MNPLQSIRRSFNERARQAERHAPQGRASALLSSTFNAVQSGVFAGGAVFGVGLAGTIAVFAPTPLIAPLVGSLGGSAAVLGALSFLRAADTVGHARAALRRPQAR